MKLKKRPLSFYVLAAFLGLFILFLYGPLFTIIILSLQGPEGSLTFPMRGFSFYWLQQVFQEQAIGSFGEPFQRSLLLGFMVMAISLVVGVSGGLAFRQPFKGSTPIFYLTIASLIVPSILVSIGIALLFEVMGWDITWYSSALAGHLTWTLPFAFLIMIGVFNRFNPSYEEAAKDLGAGEVQTFWRVVFPLIAPTLIGVGMISFTLSYDEFTRTALIAGEDNTLPLEIFGMTTNVTSPAIYGLGTVTTLFSFALIISAIALFMMFSKKQTKPSP